MENMKKILLLFSVAMLLLSCKQKAPDKIYNTDVICDSWNEFCEKKDSSSLVYFIDTLKRFDTKTFNNDMALKESVQNQIALCISLAEKAYSRSYWKKKIIRKRFCLPFTKWTRFL